MQRRMLVVAGLVIAVAVGLIVWRCSHGGGGAVDPEDDAGAAAAAGAAAPATATTDEELPRPEQPPTVTYDEDPVGPLRLEGQVLDQDDRGVGGVTVTLSSNPSRTTQSEADGSFSFADLVPRTYSLSARVGERIGGPVLHKLTDKSDPVALRLRQGATVIVTVVDESEAVVRGAVVELRDSDPQEASTDASGQVRFVGVSAGFVVLAARTASHALTLSPLQIADTAGIEVAARIVLRQGAAVRGTVVDGDGKPIAGAKIAAVDTSNLLPLGSVGASGVTTDNRGAFEFSRVAAGSYRFHASHQDYLDADSAAVVTDGVTATAGVVVALTRGGRVQGRVLDDHRRPVPWATVRVGTARGAIGAASRLRQTTTDADGTFVVRSLPRAKLAAVASSPEASSETVAFDLSAAELVEDLELILSIGGVISGVVVDGRGETIAEAQVSAFPDLWAGAKIDDFMLRGIAAETTDGGGRFSFRGVPDGTYRLRASRAEMSPSQWMQKGQQAAAGDTNVRLVLPQNGTIKGRVSYEDGGSPTLFTVAIAYPPGTPFSTEEGEFLLSEVPPGTYDLTVRGPDFATFVARKVVVQSDRELDLGVLTVKRGRSISGRVLDGSGRAVEGATVVAGRQLIADGSSLAPSFGSGQEEASGMRKATTDANGEYRLTGVGPSELLLAADHPERGRSVAATLPAAGGSQSVDLVLVPFGRVVGVVTAGGKPQAGATVIATPPANGNNIVAVRTGSDGGFVIERLPEGKHRLTGILESGTGLGGNSAGGDVVVVAGAEVKADLEIAIGALELVVSIAGKAGAQIDAAQVFLFRGAVAAASGKDIQDAFLSASGSGGANMAFAMGNNPAVFKSAWPGTSTVCVIPITGDMNDPAFAQRLQAHANDLKVYCSRHELPSTPAKQVLEVAVPAMEPLPESEGP